MLKVPVSEYLSSEYLGAGIFDHACCSGAKASFLKVWTWLNASPKLLFFFKAEDAYLKSLM